MPEAFSYTTSLNFCDGLDVISIAICNEVEKGFQLRNGLKGPDMRLIIAWGSCNEMTWGIAVACLNVSSRAWVDQCTVRLNEG
jgi:hypothetical protein